MATLAPTELTRIKVDVSHLTAHAKVFSSMARIRQLKEKVMKLMDELVPATIHAKFILPPDGGANAQATSTFEFDQRRLQHLRILFRAIVDKDYAERTSLSSTTTTNRDAAFRRYNVTFSESDTPLKTFTCELPDKFSNQATITMTLAAARALLQYLVPRLIRGSIADYQFSTPWQAKPTFNTWELLSAATDEETVMPPGDAVATPPPATAEESKPAQG